jgi:hypothetical protein
VLNRGSPGDVPPSGLLRQGRDARRDRTGTQAETGHGYWQRQERGTGRGKAGMQSETGQGYSQRQDMDTGIDRRYRQRQDRDTGREIRNTDRDRTKIQAETGQG